MNRIVARVRPQPGQFHRHEWVLIDKMTGNAEITAVAGLFPRATTPVVGWVFACSGCLEVVVRPVSDAVLWIGDERDYTGNDPTHGVTPPAGG